MFMSLFSISCLITFLVSFLFALFVFLSNRKSRLNLLWLLTALSISVWSLGFWGVVSSKTYSLAWLSQCLLDFGGILIPILFFNFVIELSGLWERYKNSIKFSLTLGILLIILSFTPLFKKEMAPYKTFNYWVVPGHLYFLFPVVFVLFTFFAFALLVLTHRRAKDKILKAQIKYVLLAQIFGFGGGITNFFPQLFKIYPFGNYFVIIYIVFISYAVLKHHLFNVRIIATELFASAISISLLIKFLLAQDIQELFIDGGIFFAVTIFGFLLVRSVINEVRQKEQIEKMAEDVKRAYEVEKKAREELEALDKSKNQFLLTIQHHLRTPLTAIMGYGDLILKGTFGRPTKKIANVVKKMQVRTQDLIKMINEFLDITQFQLGKGVINFQPGVDVYKIISDIIKELKLITEEKGIYLRLEKPDRDYLIPADSQKLKMALYNIIDNAVKYTKKGGVKIKITDGIFLKIIIQDTGIGISKENLGTLFSRVFERGVEAKKAFTTGRGIGLYLASEIIKQHKGKIWAESEGEGMGSVFHIELPASK